uniref:Diphosphomevalonate decarboxylase n=1 Tax=Parasteatoda tepidariorum TaxID=114398 RepID=A0A2L2YMZ7_PARTP
MEISFCTAVAPVNIAVIKYWGKKDEALIIPINDSFSVTLSKNEMCAKTTVACSDKFEEDKFWLNGKEQDLFNPRLQNCLRELKKRAKDKKLTQLSLHICSENNFPTAAGLASSAAGFACLVVALSGLYGIKEDLSAIARQGSGSACRSVFGGFVHWHKGILEDGSDSIAYQFASKEHWPELKILIIVVNAGKKETGSTKGMKETTRTSSLLKFRASHIVPERIKAIQKAILEKDFHSFAEITMKDSNQFHAVCLDTYPPLHYLNSTSYKIMNFIHAYNDHFGQNKVAYTFDAGPNACLYLLENEVPTVLSALKALFPPLEEDLKFIRGFESPLQPISEVLLDSFKIDPQPGAIQYIINSRIGSGPSIIEDDGQHLLNKDGLPIS